MSQGLSSTGKCLDHVVTLDTVNLHKVRYTSALWWIYGVWRKFVLVLLMFYIQIFRFFWELIKANSQNGEIKAAAKPEMSSL